MNIFRDKIINGGFSVTAELFPPKGNDASALLKKADFLKPFVDAINVTDNQRASMRLGSMAVSRLIKEMGVEPIMQMTCRDRNRIALQSDLLSASALGIENVLILSGDHPLNGEYKDAKPVYDLDTVQLLTAAGMLIKGTDLAGKNLSGTPSFCLGAVVNPTANPVELQIMMLEKKINAGAVFFQTQPIFDVSQYEDFLGKVRTVTGAQKVRILPGVALLKSAKFVKFLLGLPGVNIPQATVDRIERAPDQLAEGIKICAETISRLRGIADGVHIMAIGMEEHIPEILRQAGIKSK